MLRTGIVACGAAVYLFMQIPGCTPEPPGIGGATETVMEEGPLAPVTLRFLDGGTPTPVRIYLSHREMNYVLGPSVGYYFPIFSDLYYMSKYFPIRPDIPVLDMQFSSDHHYYFLNGEATVGLVPGPYTVTAYKGLEYRPKTATFEVSGDPMAREFTMERWIDMPSKGWYNGDGHIHLARYGREDPIYLALQEADDLHVGNIRDAAGIQMLINQVETCRATYTSADWQYVDTRIKDRLIQRCDEALTEYRKRLSTVLE